jgi:CheY-like chemotaxis protein
MASFLPKVPHVLIVDDHPVNRLVLAKTVETLGGTTDAAENGQEALDKLEAGVFDLVFMDIAMPVLDGVEATRRMRERGSHVPVVAVTAHYSRGEFASIRDAGFDDLIPKPFEIAAVLAAVEKARAGMG